MSVFVFDTLSPLKRVARNCRKCYATTFAYRHLRAVEQFNSVLTGVIVNRVRGIYVLPAGVVRCQSQVSVSVSACYCIPQCVRLIAGDWCLQVVD